MVLPQNHVLVIEDNPDHATLISESLWKIKEIKKITIIDDGHKAMEFISEAKRTKKLPDLILLDLKLPMLSGFELLKIWKSDSKTKDLPIIILSTSNIEQDREVAYSYGVKKYLVKPSDFSTLSHEIRTFL